MWTPKRALLLIGGFLIAVCAYIIYAAVLGYVDGLPKLPAGYAEEPGDDELIIRPPASDVTPAERRLRQAFGDDCVELRRPIKLDIIKYRIALATDEFSIEDGRVKMSPFSIAIFGSEKEPNRIPEINTIRSDVAYLTFDQPVATLADISNRKIVAAELRRHPDGRQQGQDAGGVRLVNNRRTSQRDDDLTLFTPGPVYYQEKIGSEPDKEPHIWTAEAVRLRDEQSRPNPTEIVAIGMDVYLATEAPDSKIEKGKGKGEKRAAPAPASAAKKPVAISGVKSVRLRSDVDMYLWTDGKAGFLGDGVKKQPGQQAEKAQLQIKTQGPFFYDVTTDRARFDISQHPGPHPNNVMVRRTHVPDTACDQLVCDHLELQFERKSAQRPAAAGGATAPASDRAVEIAIQTAHAWGSQVTLTSDLEGLTAFGNDLTYNAVSKETVLKGSPEMVVMKDGNEIYARELVMQTREEGKQQAQAKGRGHLRIFDRATGQRTIRASWNESLLSAKEGEYDILVLTGQAKFEDQEHDQELQADQLKVWLMPNEPGESKAEAAPGANRRRPNQLEAVGQVRARSPEMLVHDTDRLVVWFKDGTARVSARAAEAAASPGAPRPQPAAGPPAPAQPTQPAADGAVPAPGSPIVVGPIDPAAPPAPAKAKKPVDLSARSVVAHVLRVGSKSELEKLWCEGSVQVRQEPGSPQDKGVNILGNTLELLQFPEGHVLTVTGDPAEVQLDKLTLFGPEVTIDQKNNEAKVIGAGAMKLPSDTNFQGMPTGKPSELTVYWNREMFFDGQNAAFYGGVQAEQLESRLVCQNLQVVFDKPISLKEGQKSNGPPAKVRNLVCDQSVRITDSIYQERKLLRYSQIDSLQMSVNNEDGLVSAPGPGVVRILQPGPRGENLNRPGSPPAGDEEVKLTRINYLGRMLANNNTRTAVFYENVELIHVPTENPNLSVDIDKLPDGSFYLRCDLLNVYQRREAGNKTHQQLEARGRAMVQAKEFSGGADVIKFDESKDLIIFEATEGGRATLSRQRVRGGAPEVISGKKIYYWRRTNDFKIEGAIRLEANQ